MTAKQYAYQRVKKDWARDVKGRQVELPEMGDGVKITFEKGDTEERLNYHDVIRVIDGGIQQREQHEVGAQAERIVTLVVFELHTTNKNRPHIANAIGEPGEVRMFGYRNTENLEKEKHGGLTGEVVRIANKFRYGDLEYDRIEVSEVDDISDQYGTNTYVAQITVRFIELAAPIETEV